MQRSDGADFGSLLKAHRLTKGLSQDALAEEARVSTQAISALERGVRRTPYRDTVVLLADALGLVGAERERFEDVAQQTRRGPRRAEPVVAASAPQADAVVDGPQLVGRDADLAKLRDLLANPDVRLITLTGVGGVGKTALVTRLLADLRGANGGAVQLVSLASVTDAAAVPGVIAAAMELRETSDEGPRAELLRALRARPFLLALDNFEQIVSAAPFVVELLATVPTLRIVVTSREALRVRDEYEYVVTPLALPERDDLSLEEMAAHPSVALFVERARRVRADFTLTAESAPIVAEIVRRLDGLPLALELAAARMKVFAPGELLARLERRLAFLVSRSRDLPSRQATMRDAIAWSYDLLDDDERAVFARCGIFAGPWVFDAAVTVNADEYDRDTVEELVASLVDKSLIVAYGAEPDLPRRFRFLQTVREFALARLEERGEFERVACAHARRLAEVAEYCVKLLNGPQQGYAMARFGRFREDLRIACDWAQRNRERELAYRLTAAFCQLGMRTGLLAEPAQRVADALELGVDDDRTTLCARARALIGAARLAALRDEGARAKAFAEEALAIGRGCGETPLVADALYERAFVALPLGEYDQARAAFEESLSLRRQDEDNVIAGSLNNLGLLARYERNDAEAVDAFRRSAERCRRMGDGWATAKVIHNLGESLLRLGEIDEAETLQLESKAISETLGDEIGIIRAYKALGEIATHRNEIRPASRAFMETLERNRRTIRSRNYDGYVFEAIAELALRAGEPGRAVRLCVESLALQDSVAVIVPRDEREMLDDVLARARTELGEAAFEEARSAAQAGFDPDRAIEEALAFLQGLAREQTEPAAMLR